MSGMAFWSLLRGLGQWVGSPPQAPAGTRRELAEIGIRLIDDAYLAWLTAARECERTFLAWPTEGPDAYWAYRAALDREEAAARDLERLAALTGPCRDALSPRPKRDPLTISLSGSQKPRG